MFLMSEKRANTSDIIDIDQTNGSLILVKSTFAWYSLDVLIFFHELFLFRNSISVAFFGAEASAFQDEQSVGDDYDKNHREEVTSM